jgi:predicted PurR-regulated permease PerM
MNNPLKEVSAGSSQRIFYVTGILIFAGIILHYLKTLLIPLSFSLFLALLLVPFCNHLERRGMGRAGAVVVVMLLLTALLAGLIFLGYLQFKTFAGEWTFVRRELKSLFLAAKDSLTSDMGIPRVQVEQWINDILNTVTSRMFGMLESMITSFVINTVMLVLIPVYVFLILYGRYRLVETLYSFFPPSRREKIAEVITLSIKTYYNFIVGMALVYFIVGILNSVGLLFLGIPHAFLFGFVTAIMTFIPYIGIIVAATLPIAYAWITYNSIWYPVGVIAIFTFVQYLEANVIFPWAVGYKLHLNTLATLVIIILGGILWGGAGMVLFLPFAAIFKLIADRIEGWEPWSRLLGNDQ